MNRLRRLVAAVASFAVLAAILLTIPTVRAQDAKPTDTLDQRLFSPGASPAQSAAPRPGEDPTERLLREVESAGIPDELKPLVQIARTMHRAEQRLGTADPGKPTQQLQAQALSDLEQLLRQAEQQAGTSRTTSSAPWGEDRAAMAKAKQGSEPSGKSPSPGTAPGAGKKPAEAGPMTARQRLEQSWGELPQRHREQLLQQWSAERFLPKYQALLEAYYQRLAEEKSPGAGGRP